MQYRMKTHPLTKEQIDEILSSASTGSLATLNRDSSPYVIPVHFLHYNAKGKKLTTLRQTLVYA